MKRLIGFLMICVLFIILGVTDTRDITYLSLLVLPLTFLGDFLRLFSEQNGFGNAIAIVLFLFITSLPIILLMYKIGKGRVASFEYFALPILSIALGRTLYLFINPHILYESLNPLFQEMFQVESILDLELILTSGVAYIFYALLATYIISLIYMNKKQDSITYFKILIDFVIIIYAFSIFSVELSSLIKQVKESLIVEEKSVLILKYTAQLFTSGLLVYLLSLFRGFIIDIDHDGFQEELLVRLHKLSRYSFMLLVGTLLFQASINLYQFIVLDKLLNSSFVFDIPIVTILVVSIILIFSKYFTKIIEMKKENELFI